MTNIFIPHNVRNLHVYIAGLSGYGKSSLIHTMALHDIKRGWGVCVIDPTGDLVQNLLDWIPKNRVEDTVLLDTEHPVPIDFFSYREPKEREILTDDIIGIFDLENAPRARPLLRKVLGTLFDANESKDIPPHRRATFLDITRFIERPDRRNEILSYCPERKLDWADFPRPAEFEAVTTRMIPFFESPLLRTIFGSPVPKLNIRDAIEHGNVILVTVDINATDRLFASLVIAKIQQAAFQRRKIPQRDRKLFCLYVDEFENFQTPTFDIILSQARKYELGLTISHQQSSQLDAKIRDRLWNASSSILFRMAPKDAAEFKTLFPTGRDLYNKTRTKLEAKRDQLRIEMELMARRPGASGEYLKQEIAKRSWEMKTIETDLSHLPQGPDTPDASILTGLQKFQAVYRAADGSIQLIKTPKFPGRSPASYAEIIRKRTVEKYACEPAPDMVQSKEDAPGQSDATDDERTILPDQAKERHSRKRGAP
jgi:hypothetical protein